MEKETMFEWNHTYASVQISSSSVSFFASVATAILIYRSLGGLSCPYRRIIFGLSIADALQSFALLTGPFSISYSDHGMLPWAAGNFLTCQGNAAIMTAGVIGVPIYTWLLCIYYFRKAKYPMSNTAFLNKIERRVHIFVVIIVVLAITLAIVTKAFNPLPAGTACFIISYPPGCSQSSPDIHGECTRGATSSRILNFILMFGLNIIFIPWTILTTLLLYCHVKSQERLFRADVRRVNHTEQEAELKESSCLQSFGRKIGRILMKSKNYDGRQYGRLPHETRAKYIARLYRREILKQAGLYVTTFFGAYSMGFFFGLTNNVDSMKHLKGNGLSIAVSLIYPLGGLFNILIYSRPKVALLRRNCRRFTWLQCQWIVLRAGCELPSEDELRESIPWFSWNYNGKSRKSGDLNAENDSAEKSSEKGLPIHMLREEPLSGNESMQSLKNGRREGCNDARSFEDSSKMNNSIGSRNDFISDLSDELFSDCLSYFPSEFTRDFSFKLSNENSFVHSSQKSGIQNEKCSLVSDENIPQSKEKTYYRQFIENYSKTPSEIESGDDGSAAIGIDDRDHISSSYLSTIVEEGINESTRV